MKSKEGGRESEREVANDGKLKERERETTDSVGNEWRRDEASTL